MFSPRKRAQCTPLGLVFDDGFRLLFLLPRGHEPCFPASPFNSRCCRCCCHYQDPKNMVLRHFSFLPPREKVTASPTPAALGAHDVWHPPCGGRSRPAPGRYCAETRTLDWLGLESSNGWRFPKLGILQISPNHPNLEHFSIETYGKMGTPF